MAKCEVIDLIMTLMVISSKRRKPPMRFCYQASVGYIKFLYIKFLLHQVPTTTGFVHVRSSVL